MIDDKYKYSALTERIIGCAMKVHSTLGNGFQEIIYQRCLAIEMSKQGLSYEREKEMPIFYEGQSVGTRRVDFFVANGIMVELKAITVIEDVHLAQTINYLEAYNMEVGLLINFGARSLDFKRVQNKKFNKIVWTLIFMIGMIKMILNNKNEEIVFALIKGIK